MTSINKVFLLLTDLQLILFHFREKNIGNVNGQTKCCLETKNIIVIFIAVILKFLVINFIKRMSQK